MWRSIFVLSAVALAACSRDDRVSTTNLTSARLITNDAAIDRIVTARCARDAACSNVGLNKDFAQNNQCEPRVTARLHETMTSCATGVDSEALQRCLTAIDTEGCDNPLDEILRQNDCRPGNLCLKAR